MDELQTQTWIEPLNPREVEILSLISEGLSNREISQKLLLSLETIKWYNKQIYSKLGVSSRTQAVNTARKNGLLKSSSASVIEEALPSKSNLPAQLTSFIGRTSELAEIKMLLRSSRLVTLTGAGGTGKTRLAMQVASELSGAYRDGVWLIELASTSDPDLVVNALTQALKLTPIREASLVEVLERFLKGKHLLLLMDNFEHLLMAAPLVGRLLAAAPQVTVLVTSREILHLYGEQEYTVQPLKPPDMLSKESLGQLLANEAVNLFLQRARAIQPRLELDERQLRAVAQICVRLDGLPLAIELAASQVKIYRPSVLAKRLEDNLGSLPIGPRDLPERQRTLHATIEWSEHLLQPEERVLFVRLAVFKGAATLEAIERVCSQGLTKNMIDLLTALVDKNLLMVREGWDGEVRFMMLETIHEYARELLSAEVYADELNKLHAAYYTGLAEEAGKEFRGTRQVYWSKYLRSEQDNLRGALAWSLGGQEIEYGLRLVIALNEYWYYNGLAAEGMRWTNIALTQAAGAPLILQAGVFCTAGNLTYSLNYLKEGKEFLQRSLELYRELGDEQGAAVSSIMLSITGVDMPEEIPQSIRLAQESLVAFRRLGNKADTARALNILGELYRVGGDYEAAAGCYEACLELVKETGELQREGIQYCNLGLVATHHGQYQQAKSLIRQAIIISQEIDNIYLLSTSIASMVGATTGLGQPKKAARLLGADEAIAESLGIK